MRSRLALLAVPLVAGMFLYPPRDEPPAGGMSDIDSRAATCGGCHRTIYDQWKSSQHAKAWTSEVYQAWIKTKTKPAMCHRCHIPDAVVAKAPDRPDARETALDEGVSCAACHVHDGKVHGPLGLQCTNPTAKSDLHAEGIALCQACHRIVPKPVLSIGKDFEEANLAAKGQSCKGCHMPEYEGHVAFDPKSGEPIGEKRKLRSHAFEGRLSPKAIAKAFAFASEEKDGKVVLRLENKAGHRLPGITLRSYKVRFELLDEQGGVLGSKEGDINDETPLPVAGALSVELTAPPGMAKARVRVRHWWQALPADEPRDLGTVFEAER